MEYKTLGSICEIVSGGTPSRSNAAFWDGGTIPWIKISDIKSKYISQAEEHITQAGLNGSSAKMVTAGSILYTIFATLGEVGILTFDACTNQAIAALSVKEPAKIRSDYLYYYLKAKKDYINSLGRGVAQNNINLSILRSLMISIVDPDQQKKIVTVLGKCESLTELYRCQLAKLNELEKARFVELFGDPVKNDRAWEQQQMYKVAPVKAVPGIKSGRTWLLNLDMIEPSTGRIIDHYYTDVSSVGASTYAFDTDNVLYSKLRPYLNKVVVPTQGGYCTTELIPLRPSEKLNRQFLAYLLRSDAFVAYINEKVAGAKMPRVSMDVFKEFKCILPPIDLQNKFADFVTQVEKTKAAVQRALDKAQLLFDSLMQQYFG